MKQTIQLELNLLKGLKCRLCQVDWQIAQSTELMTTYNSQQFHTNPVLLPLIIDKQHHVQRTTLL
jgi:hypothetical protein